MISYVVLSFMMPSTWMPDSWAKAFSPTMALFRCTAIPVVLLTRRLEGMICLVLIPVVKLPK